MEDSGKKIGDRVKDGRSSVSTVQKHTDDGQVVETTVTMNPWKYRHGHFRQGGSRGVIFWNQKIPGGFCLISLHSDQ
jgi:hypothetical protein